MSEHHEIFQLAATRGTPIGATALLQRVEDDLANVTSLETPPRRSFNGLMVAAAAFVAVLLVGGVWALMTRTGVSQGPVVDAFGIEWRQLGEEPMNPDSLVAGPGGFVRSVFSPSAGGLEFSNDGANWTRVLTLESTPAVLLRAVMSSNDHWLATSFEHEGSPAWRSSDGLNWHQVVWPEGHSELISEVIAIPAGFLAVSRDRFGDGTKHWWSESAETWVEVTIPEGSEERSEFVRGTSAGLVSIPGASSTDTGIAVAIAPDGVTWQTSVIPLPPDLGGELDGWSIDTVEKASETWIAFGEIELVDADPFLNVWTSADGVAWVSRGSPPFGQVDHAAVWIREVKVSAGILVVLPTTTPVVVDDSGRRRTQGSVVSTGELWATTDGRSWTWVVDTSADVLGVALNATVDDPVGLWLGQPRSFGEQPVTETTMSYPPPPQELDRAGLRLQEEILADGAVTEAEFRSALEGWKRCMEDRGIVGATYELDARGGVGFSYPSPTADTGEAEMAACAASYIDELSLALAE